MNEKTMNLINKILYYVIAPILILEFILTDLHIISFTKILFIASVVVLLILCAISFFYKKQHPDYEFKANEMYTRISLQLYSLNVSTLPDFSNGRFIQYHILSDEIKKNHCIAND